MKTVLTALFAASGALAQQSLWGQCGGIGWTGPTTCTADAYCEHWNDWYYQCVPGQASTTASQTTTTPSTTFTTWASTTSSTTSTSSPPTGTGFATTSGTMFNIDGTVKYWQGTNCYPCSENLDQASMETALQHMAADGLKIIRVWGFNDVNSNPGSGAIWFQSLSSSGSTINTGANGLQRLDNVVAAAEANGLKLIIPFVNNWDDYGGISAYVNAFGGSHQTWYTNQAAQAQYRTYIDAVISRYRNSPAIFAWELANEPRCQGCDTSVIYNWATETSQYVKSLDPDHMVTLGDEGFGIPQGTSYPYTTYEGVDWEMNLGIETLDFATFHLYPNSWGISDAAGNDWVIHHAELCAAAGKPCFFEEYGTESDKCTVMGEWQETSETSAGMAGDAFWQYGDDSSWHNDGHTVYRGSAEYQCLVTERDI